MLINGLVPMKTFILLTCLALLSSEVYAADPSTSPPQPNSNVTPPPAPAVERATRWLNLNGKATVTIDVNGQKVTREIDLSNPQQFDGGEVLSVTKIASPKTVTEVRTWLGVVTDEVSDEVRAQLPLASGVGLLVREVIADSPAAKAGLQKNDVLTKLDDQILANSDQLRALVGMKPGGDSVQITYLRKGQEAAVEAKLVTHAEETTDVLNAPILSRPVLSEPVRKQIFKKFENGDDTTFISRIYLELAGRPPTPDEIKAFVADPDLAKRATLVKRLFAAGDEKRGASPIIIERSAAFDKDGNLFWTIQGKSAGGKDDALDNEQWHLFSNGVHADVTEEMKKLEKSLHDAGLNDETIAKTRQAVAETIGQVQKAVRDASGSKDEIQRRAQKAMEEIRRAIENAWRPEEGEASKLPATPREVKPPR
jgi:hypothetical protein